jgi:hypothetical protein
MANEELHDIVDIEKIEPVSVDISDGWEEAEARGKTTPVRLYTITYSLPIRVSKTWQYMFQKPDEMSGVVHQVAFEFSEDGDEAYCTLESEPSPELIFVLTRYALRANKRWLEHLKAAEGKPSEDKPSEEERLLKKLKGDE